MRNTFFSAAFYLVCIHLTILTGITAYSQSIDEKDKYLTQAEQLQFDNPDSAVYFYEKSINYQLEAGDTAAAVNSLAELSLFYAHNVEYGKSYDGYWDALLLADAAKDTLSLARVYQELGWLYTFYNRNREAIKYLNLSLQLNKSLGGELAPDPIRSSYFALAMFYITNKNYEVARVYLDSCIIIEQQFDVVEHNDYVLAELGYLQGLEGDFEEGIKNLTNAETYFKVEEPEYLILIYYMMAQVYGIQGDFEKTKAYYNKALEMGEKYKRHTNTFPLIYEGLSDLYASKGMYADAYESLANAKNLNEDIFGGRSKTNQYLLQIKDDFRQEKEKQKQLQQERRLKDLEQEERIRFLQTILFTISLLSIIIVGFLILRNMRLKFRTEKEIIERERRVEKQKHKEVLELKNKELATFALQLVEKDEFLKRLKEKLQKQESESVDSKVIDRMINAAQNNPAANWKEFEARFVDINQSFYKNLKEKYPKLSQSDQKVCALIKLNFSSKEMASLLAISVESVHTSRYRIRKKFNLKRDESLSEFIDDI